MAILPRRIEFAAIVFILLSAAAVRFYQLDRLPGGFSGEEIDTLRIVQSIHAGQIGVFYNLQAAPYAGHEALLSILESLVPGLVGEGLLAYRLIPSLAGLLGVALTYAAARRLIGFPGALIASLAMGFGLWPVLLSRLAIAQTLIVPCAAAALWLLAKALSISSAGITLSVPRTRVYTVLGAILAIAVYAHWTGLMLWLMALVLTIYLQISRQPLAPRTGNYAGYAALVTLILSIPYLTTALRLPGLSGPAALWLQRPATIGDILLHARDLLVVLLNGSAGQVALLVLVAIVFAIGLFTAARRWRQPNMGLLLIALGCGLLPAIWTGRGDFNLAAAFPPAVILIGLGGTTLLDTARSASRRQVWRLGFAAAAIGLALGVNDELFERWAMDPSIASQYHSEMGRVALYLDQNGSIDGSPILICTTNLFGQPDRPMADPTLLRMMIHRQEINWRFADCTTAVVLANGGQAEQVIFDYADHNIPATLQNWLPPDVVIDKVPGTGHMALATINVEKRLADAVGKLTLSQVDWPPDLPGAHEPLLLPVRMGDYLHFEGYILDSARRYKPGDFIHLTTYWRIDGAQQPDLRVFAHVLVDPGSPPVIQNDILALLPADLRDRDIVIQGQTIQVPYPFPEGLYYLSIGAYHTDTQARVPFYDSSDQIHGDRLFLGTLQIKG